MPTPPPPPPHTIGPLRDFVVAATRLIETSTDEARLLDEGGALLSALIARDDWLSDELAQPHPERYQQYLLHADPLDRLSVVSFVWGPGQATPVHDHTVWGLVGVLRGREAAQAYTLDSSGRPRASGEEVTMLPGQVDVVSPRLGDIHRVRNADPAAVSVSIHVYGANIGRVHRSVYTADGQRKPFVSGYSNKVVPNLWAPE